MMIKRLHLWILAVVLTSCTDKYDNPTPQPTDDKALVGTWVGDLTGKTHTMWTYGKAWNVWTFNADGTGVCDVYFTSNDQPVALQHQPFTYVAEGGTMTETLAPHSDIRVLEVFPVCGKDYGCALTNLDLIDSANGVALLVGLWITTGNQHDADGSTLVESDGALV